MPRPRKSDEPATQRRDRERFAALKQELTELDVFVRGSLVRVRSRCGKKTCACATDPDARRGPYVRWTRKVAGRTVSTPVRDDEVPAFEQWLANSRRVDELVDEMHALGLRAVERLVKARSRGRR